MLDFRRRSQVSSYLGPRQQRRWLLMLCFWALVIVAVLRLSPIMENLRGGQPERAAAADEAEPGEAPGGARLELFSGVRADYLEAVRDDEVFRTPERDAWFHLLAILQSTPPEALKAASLGQVGFVQLDNQAAWYRGRVVSVAGVIRAAKLVEAPTNAYGIERYYQLWLQPQASAPELLVIYALELPEGFPLGDQLDASAAATGFFFKRWAYQSQGGIVTAPLILARSIDWQPPPAPVAVQPVGGEVLWAVAAAAALALVTVAVLATRTRRRAPAPSPGPPLGEIVVPGDVAPAFDAAEARREA